MKDEKGLGNVAQPSYGIGGMGPLKLLTPNSRTKKSVVVIKNKLDHYFDLLTKIKGLQLIVIQ